jgi:hypothetical protein
MRTLRDGDWKPLIVVAVHDQSWDSNFGQAIDVVVALLAH